MIDAKHRSRILLFLILTVALIARFRYLTQIEHNVDHAYPIWQAMQTIDWGILPLTGQGTSVLFANPPLTGYLFIPVVALSRSPLGVYVFIIALNWLAVWMAYRAVRGLLGVYPALIAAGMMSVNPWTIEYSRTSWVQSLLPFFVCAVAWLMWPVLTQQSHRPARRLALALTTAAVFAHTYLLAYFIVVPIIVLLIIYRKRIPVRGLVIGCAVFVVLAGLYSIGLIQQWDDVQQRISNFSAGEARINSEAWDAAVRLVSGSEYELARGLDAPAGDSALRHDLSQPSHWVILAAIVIGLAAAVYHVFWVRRGMPHLTPRPPLRSGEREKNRSSLSMKEQDAAVILLVWFWLPVVAMSYTSNPVHPFYQILGFPAGFALAAWGLDIVFRPGRWWPGTAMLLILALPFGALMLTNSARYYQETAAVPGAHELSALPVDYGLQMGRAINTAGGMVVFADTEEAWILNSFAGRLFPVIRDTRAPNFSIIPRDGGAYVTISDGVPPLPPLADRIEQINLPDGKVIAVDRLPESATVENQIPGIRLNIPSEQGLTLLTYDIQREGEMWNLFTTWRVDHIAPDVYALIFAPFLHVFDANGDPALNVNGEGLPGHKWSVGDIHVHQMTFMLPDDRPQPFTMKLGQFDGLHGVNIVFLPESSEPDVVITLGN